MKRILIFLFLFILAVCAAVLCFPSGPRYDKFDPENEGILDVQLSSAYGESKGPFFYTLASGKRIMESEPFAPDEMQVYDVPGSCFESYIDDKVRNRLKKAALLDSSGNSVPVTQDMEKLFSCLAQLEHAFLEIQIIETGGEYFAYVQLNVNLWTPCALYHYDRESAALTELYTWDNRKISGLRLRAPGLL